jgi:geranylgeranylglycerol-phosphate geranylgeranyltransferase
MPGRILVYLEILRPHNMLVAAFAIVTGFYAAGGRDASAVTWLAALCALATGAGNVANDVFDADIDRVNKPRRPIPSGRMSPRAAGVFYAVLSCVVVLLALVNLPIALIAIVLAWQAALFLYARWLKRAWPAGNLAVATIAASALIGGGMAADGIKSAVLPAAITFAFVWCRELVKGLEDVAGDRAAGARTLAVLAGSATAARIAAASMWLVAIALPLPSVVGVYHTAYGLIMLACVAPALIIGATTAIRAGDARAFARVSRWLKLAMFAGLAAIIAGT